MIDFIGTLIGSMCSNGTVVGIVVDELINIKIYIKIDTYLERHNVYQQREII